MVFGDKLKELIDRKGISIAELSRRTGINCNTLYSYIRRNTKKPDPNVLQVLADALGVDIYYFLGLQGSIEIDSIDDLIDEERDNSKPSRLVKEILPNTNKFREALSENILDLDSADRQAALESGDLFVDIEHFLEAGGNLSFEKACEYAEYVGISIDEIVLERETPIRQDERTPEVIRLFARLTPQNQEALFRYLQFLLAEQRTNHDSQA